MLCWICVVKLSGACKSEFEPRTCTSRLVPPPACCPGLHTRTDRVPCYVTKVPSFRDQSCWGLGALANARMLVPRAAVAALCAKAM